MEEIIRNTQGNNTFFYVFMVVLVILAIGSNLFKKNLSLLFSDDFETDVANSFPFIFCGILLFSISGGLFINSVFQKLQLDIQWDFNITNFTFINNLLITSFFCFLFILIRFFWTVTTFYVLHVKINIEFYFLLRLRYILFLSFTLLTLAIIIRYMYIDYISLYNLLSFVGLLVLLGFIIVLFKRFIYLKNNTDIPLYYIILYLCALELLPIAIIGKILIISS